MLPKPYVLGDVKKSNFDCLLAHLYPRTLEVEGTQTTETQTTQYWISILELASKWGFNSLRSKAISRIEQTLDSPVDMVTLGHQYGIPDFLLPGYAVLCQSTVPLSYEEGLRLGMEDVVNVYRIRHELYGSGITPVSLKVAFAKVEEAGLGAQRPRQELNSERASTWTDVESVTASQTSAENEKTRNSVPSTPNIDFSTLDVVSTDAATFVSGRPEQQHNDAHSLSDEPTLGNGSSDVPSCIFPDVVSDDPPPEAEWFESVREGLNLVEELTDKNFDLASVEIMQWINTKDIRTLRQVTQLIVEKAIKALDESYPCVRLCRAMVKYTQARHQITRLIVGKAMKEPCQSGDCAHLCNMLMRATNGDAIAGGTLFSDCLGQICQENLETIATLVAAAGNHTARVQRLRLVEFIGALVDLKAVNMWATTIIDSWVLALLDANDEEKVATLCMVMTRAGRLGTYRNKSQWIQWVQYVARESSKPRVRELLQEVIKRGSVTWAVAEPSDDCKVQ